MLKERARLISSAVFTVDLALVAAAFVLAHAARGGWLPALGIGLGAFYPLDRYLPLLPLALAIWALLLLTSKLYRSHRTVPFPRESWEILKVCVAAGVLFTLVNFFLRLDERLLDRDQISRGWILLFTLTSFALIFLARGGLRLFARWARLRGYNFRTVLIVGASELGLQLAESIERHRYWGYRVLGFLRTETDPDGEALGGFPILGRVEELLERAEKEVVDEVLFVVGRRELAEAEELLVGLQELGVNVRFALNPFPVARGRLEVSDLEGVPVLSFPTAPTSPSRLFLKRAIDVGVAAVLLAMLSPVFVLIALAILLTSKGPVLFRQTRAGLYGRPFTILKFRTMVSDAEERRQALAHLNEMRGPVFKVAKDPRVTPVGRVLRKFSLDELPQLWNVLKGEMSLVGPRPPVPEETAQYQRWQRRRLSMRPGLTCLWQVSGRNQVDFDRWMELDLQYIDSWSPMLDFKILLKTIPTVLSGRGAS